MTILISLLLSVLGIFMRGLLIKTFWSWFIISQFTSLPPISTMAALGFSLFVGALSPWKGLTAKELEESKNKNKEDSVTLAIHNSLLYTMACMFSLFIGWVVHYFM